MIITLRSRRNGCCAVRALVFLRSAPRRARTTSPFFAWAFGCATLTVPMTSHRRRARTSDSCHPARGCTAARAPTIVRHFEHGFLLEVSRARLLQNFGHAPADLLRDRARLDDPHAVADAAALVVMHLETGAVTHDLLVEGMRLADLHEHDHCLSILSLDDDAVTEPCGACASHWPGSRHSSTSSSTSTVSATASWAERVCNGTAAANDGGTSSAGRLGARRASGLRLRRGDVRHGLDERRSQAALDLDPHGHRTGDLRRISRTWRWFSDLAGRLLEAHLEEAPALLEEVVIELGTVIRRNSSAHRSAWSRRAPPGRTRSPRRMRNRVLIGSLNAARRIASCAVSPVTPAISKSTRPGCTTATQPSGGPLPLPSGSRRASWCTSDQEDPDPVWPRA